MLSLKFIESLMLLKAHKADEKYILQCHESLPIYLKDRSQEFITISNRIIGLEDLGSFLITRALWKPS